MTPTKFHKFDAVWAKSYDGKEFMGTIKACWIRTGGEVIYRVYILPLDKSYEVQECDLRIRDEEF